METLREELAYARDRAIRARDAAAEEAAVVMRALREGSEPQPTDLCNYWMHIGAEMAYATVAETVEQYEPKATPP